MLKRLFSTTRAVKSNVGSAAILMPAGTSVSLSPKILDDVTALRMALDKKRNGKPKIHLTKSVNVSGPKGEVNLDLADFVDVAIADNKASVTVEEPNLRHQRAMWGTSRSLVANAVAGVNEGHLCIVKLVGTGFRAVLDNDRLILRLGYCVPQIVNIPAGVHVQVPVPHRIVIEGCDKQSVKLLASEIRKFRKPEPYKGKGVFVDNETIKLKQKKIK